MSTRWYSVRDALYNYMQRSRNIPGLHAAAGRWFGVAEWSFNNSY